MVEVIIGTPLILLLVADQKRMSVVYLYSCDHNRWAIGDKPSTQSQW